MKNQNNKANENKNKVNDCGGKCGKNSEKKDYSHGGNND